MPKYTLTAALKDQVCTPAGLVYIHPKKSTLQACCNALQKDD